MILCTHRNACEDPIRTVVALLLPLLSFAACTEITALPQGSERYEPPPVYRLWWEMTEACSGRTGKLGDVEWYVVPGVTSVRQGGADVAAFWSTDHNTVVLAGESQMDGSVVRHEMLHALLFDGGHPRSLFLGTCGGIVACVDSCVDDAGPPPAPAESTPLVPPDSIETTVEIRPPAPSGAQLGGYFTLTVTAHNPANHAVVVVLPSSDGGEWRESFAWSMRSGDRQVDANVLAYDPGVTYFAAGETKRQVFDCHVNGDEDYETIPPGDYVVEGSYGGHKSAPLPLTVAP